MNPTPQLLAQLHADKHDAARRHTPEQKLFAGAELFDYAAEITKAGIRAQHPHADESQVTQLLRDRLALAARLEQSP